MLHFSQYVIVRETLDMAAGILDMAGIGDAEAPADAAFNLTPRNRWHLGRNLTGHRDSVTPQRLPKPTRGQWPAAQKTITRDSFLRRRAVNGVRSRYKRLLASAKWSFLPINE